METIHERVLKVIEAQTTAARRFKDLEAITGIGVKSWTAMWHKRQRPTMEMIEKVAQLWPDYAYWLATGITEPETGHVAPVTFTSRYPVMRGQQIAEATKEREYLIAELLKNPTAEDELVAQTRDLEDAVFKAREAQYMPGIWLNHERIARELGEPTTPELFLLELDKEFVQTRQERAEQQMRRLKATHTHRKHNLELMPMEKGVGLFMGWVKKILKTWRPNAG